MLWAKKYHIIGRKRAERFLGGCSSPLSLTCQQYFPTEAPGWSSWVVFFFIFENPQSFLLIDSHWNIFSLLTSLLPLPVQQRVPNDQVTHSFSCWIYLLIVVNWLLKIKNILSPYFPLSVQQTSRDRRQSYANLTFQHTFIHFGGKLLGEASRNFLSKFQSVPICQ